MNEEERFDAERVKMVERQIARRGVHTERVLAALRATPRHCFVDAEYRHLAYTDGPLPIGNGQTISQPYIVALMSELLELEGHERVLEVGTGSGYQAAVLAHLAREVYSIERHAQLGKKAAKIISGLGLSHVNIRIGDGTLGWPECAPYDAIMVTAAAPDTPKALLQQLTEGGRLVIPVGSLGTQFLERWIRCGDDYERERIIPVAFVPLIGAQGWDA